MKCIKDSNGKIKRVTDGLAEKAVRQLGWKYCPKSEWKALKRSNI